MFTHFSPKTTIFALLRGHFWPKTWKIKCFQFIQSKISQFVTQMWLPKKLQFLVPGTPPDPPIPPLTPPRGPGEPKMAKMHSLKSNNDNECQKSHFRGVKNFDLFFHSECTSSQYCQKVLQMHQLSSDLLWPIWSCLGNCAQWIFSDYCTEYPVKCVNIATSLHTLERKVALSANPFE